MPVSDDFRKLKEQVEQADRSIRESAAKDQAELKAMVDEARKRAETAFGRAACQVAGSGGQAERQWNEVRRLGPARQSYSRADRCKEGGHRRRHG